MSVPLLPYWIYRVDSKVPGWRGWRLKAWGLLTAWRCEECGSRSWFGRIDTPIGRSPHHPWWGRWGR